MTTSADFDGWYADRVESPVADELVRRVLGLPPDLQSTSLLGGAGLDEVVAALDLHAGQVLLDLACGRAGYGLEIARRTGCRLVGVDFSAVAIGQAESRARELGLERTGFQVGDLTRTGLDPASSDAVLVVDALQFAEPKAAALRECLRVLVPGGRLAITCWEPLEAGDERLPERIRHLDLAAQLPAAGFVDVEVTGKPEWRVLEKKLWQESLTFDAADDPAMRSMQAEARHVLSSFDRLRRVLATATAPR